MYQGRCTKKAFTSHDDKKKWTLQMKLHQQKKEWLLKHIHFRQLYLKEMIFQAGVEPTISCVLSRRHNQLDHRNERHASVPKCRVRTHFRYYCSKGLTSKTTKKNYQKNNYKEKTLKQKRFDWTRKKKRIFFLNFVFCNTRERHLKKRATTTFARWLRRRQRRRPRLLL